MKRLSRDCILGRTNTSFVFSIIMVIVILVVCFVKIVIHYFKGVMCLAYNGGGVA